MKNIKLLFAILFVSISLTTFGNPLKFAACESEEHFYHLDEHPTHQMTANCLCPDLIISSSKINKTTVQCGAIVTATTSVKNVGVATAKSFSTLGYFLSSNTTWDPFDTHLSSDQIGTLAPGFSNHRTRDLTIPSSVSPGNYYILFVADYTDKVTETNENNNVAYRPLTVTCGGPDLTVPSTNVSNSNVSCGGSLTAICYVRNIGDQTTNTSSTLGYYLSTNSTFGSSDILLATDHVNVLSAGAQSFEYAALTIPNNISPGKYFILFVADHSNFVTETNESNNVAFESITVTCASGPDLIVSDHQINASNVLCGGSIVALAEVENVGNATTNSWSRLGYYLSTNTTWGASDIPLTNDPVGNLSPGGTSFENATLTIPNNTSPGTYYILFVADMNNQVNETNENNNVAFDMITVSCGGSDLVISSRSTNINTLACGGSLTAYATVKNVGTVATNSSSTLGYYLSTNKTWESNVDLPVGTDFVGVLSPGGTSFESASITLPNNTAPGTYYLLFVADRNDVVNESNENNNVAYLAITVTCGVSDLIISSRSVSTTNVNCGSSLTAYATVKNIGNQTTNSFSYLRYYISTNTTWDATDTPLASDYVINLPAGTSSNESASLTIPSGLTTGTYYILFVADYSDLVVESNENNNVGYLAINVTCCTPETPTASEIDNSQDVYCTYAYGMCQGHTGDYKQFQLKNIVTGAVTYHYTTSHFVFLEDLTASTNYRYRVRIKCGTSGPYGSWSPYQYFTTTSCLLDDSGNGATAKLEEPKDKSATPIIAPTIQNYPNPFNGQTTIKFDLIEAAPVTLFISDVTGKKVRVLLNNEERFSGINLIPFDGSDLSSGIYYYTVQAGKHTITNKMVLNN